jgi:hypothetical protein
METRRKVQALGGGMQMRGPECGANSSIEKGCSAAKYSAKRLDFLFCGNGTVDDALTSDANSSFKNKRMEFGRPSMFPSRKRSVAGAEIQRWAKEGIVASSVFALMVCRLCDSFSDAALQKPDKYRKWLSKSAKNKTLAVSREGSSNSD